jgi:hypothetical protein
MGRRHVPAVKELFGRNGALRRTTRKRPRALASDFFLASTFFVEFLIELRQLMYDLLRVR